MLPTFKPTTNRCRNFQAKKRIAAKILRYLVSLRTIEARYMVPRNPQEARQSNLRSFYYRHHVSAQLASFEVPVKNYLGAQILFGRTIFQVVLFPR